MKDIYVNMNNQNILKYYGTKLDLKLDSSEYYDHEIVKNAGDYNKDVLDLTREISYTGLTINTSLNSFICIKSTVKLIEIDNTANDPDYIYSGLTFTLNYTNFVANFDTTGVTYENVILNNHIYTYTGITDETHYFKKLTYNLSPSIDNRITGKTETDIISEFSKDIIDCVDKLEDPELCCPTQIKLGAKPWAYDFNTGSGPDNCSPQIKRRTSAGWTLDFVLNRQDLDWVDGGIFYYIGVRGDDDIKNYADNNLSFGFTPDGKVKWTAIHYSGVCQSGYTETYYTASGETPTICMDDPTKDFNLTIVFERNNYYDGCDIENSGGWNDLIRGPHAIEGGPNFVTEVTGSSVTDQVTVGYTITNGMDVVLSGETPTYQYIEELNKNWADERNRRLGTLKIYLNGRPIYKLKNWEEVIPSTRGVQPFIQSWGGGTGLMGDIHNGVCCFNVKKIQYYEEPLDFVHVRHHYLTSIKPNFDIKECGILCDNVPSGFVKPTPTPTNTPITTATAVPTPTPTPTNTPITTATAVPTPTPTNTVTPTPTPTPTPTNTVTPTPTPTPTPTLFIPNNDLTYVIIPGIDMTYIIIPNNDSTYTLIPNNDLTYLLLQPTPNPTPTPTPTPTSTTAEPTPTETPTLTPTPTSAGFQWMTINSVTDSTASGIGQNDITLSVTQSGGGMGVTNGVFNPTVFPEEYGVPFTGNQIQNINSGTFTATFSQPVTDALVAFASIGHGGLYVPIEVSTPFTPIFGLDVSYQNPVNGTQYTQLTGNEGYSIIRIDGTVTTVTFNYTESENYCNVCFGFVNQNTLPTSTPTPTSTETPTPTPTVTYYYYYLLNCNLGDNKYGRSANPSLIGNIFNVDAYTCYTIVGNDYGPSYDYDLDVATMVTDCTDILCNVATSTPTPTSTETPTPTPTSTETPTPTPTETPTPTPTESPLDFTISSDCVNGGAIYTNNHIGGSGVYDRGTGLYDTELEALNETGWFQIMTPSHYVSNGVPYFNTTRTYWVALRDRNNPSNIIVKSILVDCEPTPTPTPTSTPTPTPTATSTPTPTPTLPPLNFTISGICQNDGSIRLSDLVGSASNNYQYTGGAHTTENSALNATFWGSIVGGNIGVVTIGSSGTYWVAVRETENPSNIIAKSVTINCVETSGLVLHYDPSLTTSYIGTGTTINDLTGQGRTGTMSNITFTSPYLTFNGTSSQISVPDSIGLEPQTGDWTIEVWVNQSVAGNDVVLGKFPAGGATVSYSIRTTNTSYYAQLASSSGYQNSTTHVGTIGTWYQLVYVFTNVAANTFETFVNGTSIGSISHSLSSILNTTTNLYIGSYNNGEYAQWFDGKIGIVRMYNKSLTSSEVLGNYNTDKSKYGLS